MSVEGEVPFRAGDAHVGPELHLRAELEAVRRRGQDLGPGLHGQDGRRRQVDAHPLHARELWGGL